MPCTVQQARYLFIFTFVTPASRSPSFQKRLLCCWLRNHLDLPLSEPYHMQAKRGIDTPENTDWSSISHTRYLLICLSLRPINPHSSKQYVDFAAASELISCTAAPPGHDTGRMPLVLLQLVTLLHTSTWHHLPSFLQTTRRRRCFFEN